MIAIPSLDLWIACLKKNELKSNIDLIPVGFHLVIFVVFKLKISVTLRSVSSAHLSALWDDTNKLKIYSNGSLMRTNPVVSRLLTALLHQLLHKANLDVKDKNLDGQSKRQT